MSNLPLPSPFTGLQLTDGFGALALENGRKRRVKRARKKAARREARAVRKSTRQTRRIEKKTVRQQVKQMKKAARKGTAPPAPLRRAAPLRSASSRSPNQMVRKAGKLTGGSLYKASASQVMAEEASQTSQPWSESAAMAVEQGPSASQEFQPSGASSASYWDGGSSGGGGGGGGMEAYPPGQTPAAAESGEDEEVYAEEGGSSSKWLIGGAAALLLGGVGYYMYKRNKNKSELTEQDGDEDAQTR